jgi:hypothetical protein
MQLWSVFAVSVLPHFNNLIERTAAGRYRESSHFSR